MGWNPWSCWNVLNFPQDGTEFILIVLLHLEAVSIQSCLVRNAGNHERDFLAVVYSFKAVMLWDGSNDRIFETLPNRHGFLRLFFISHWKIFDQKTSFLLLFFWAIVRYKKVKVWKKNNILYLRLLRFVRFYACFKSRTRDSTPCYVGRSIGPSIHRSIRHILNHRCFHLF